MPFQSLRFVVASAWVMALCVAGRIAELHTARIWAVVAALAIVPPIVMMWRWHGPEQTLSQSITTARR
jgi:hypothetical protein